MSLLSIGCALVALVAWQNGPAAPPVAIVTLDVAKSTILENVNGIKRVAAAAPEIADAVAVSHTEVMVNGKAPGETNVILWDMAGHRVVYDIRVEGYDRRPEIVEEELAREFPDSDIGFHAESGTVFLRGTVRDVVEGDRAAAIASMLGKVVNLLRVEVPPAEPQILLKVRFADVDRSASTQLGLNLISTGALRTDGSISTAQINPPGVTQVPNPLFTISDPLNIFLYRPDLNLGATLSALESKQLVEILAEPNLLTMSGRPASFLSGGEFPFPTLQGGGSGIGQVTIQFHEFGVRLNFLPVVTPRGTIRLKVSPEVSSLDFANGLTVDGFTVPGLATRRVDTEIELADGQSFVIGGLIDNQLTDTIDKIPGLGNIPLLGKLFQSKVSSRSRSELLVIVTPEIVRPTERNEKPAAIPMPKPFLQGGIVASPQSPAAAPEPGQLPRIQSVPIEVLRGSLSTGQQSTSAAAGPAPGIASPGVGAPQAVPGPNGPH